MPCWISFREPRFEVIHLLNYVCQQIVEYRVRSHVAHVILWLYMAHVGRYGGAVST